MKGCLKMDNASNARHAVARKLLTVMWAMWKTNSRFDESMCKPDTEMALASSRLSYDIEDFMPAEVPA